MARTTIVAEVSCRMIRVCRLDKLRLVALVAIVERELVVVVRMTCLALRCCVRAGQWEIREVMIERSTLPSSGGVALRAVMTVVSGDMIRVVRVCKIICMTLKACQWKILKLIVHMTLCACRCRVRACEREPCGIVIERCGSPRHRRMTCSTVS
jgi:hypothetical protein